MLRSRETARRAAKDADDVELEALRVGIQVPVPLDEALYDDSLSEEALEQRLNKDIAVDPAGGPDAVAQALLEDAETESVLANVDLVLRDRQDILGDYYPFERTGNTISYRGSRTLSYELCLAIVHVENISYRAYKPLQAAFERLAAIAMSRTIASALFVRTGYPQDSELDDEPGNIQASTGLLNALMPDTWSLDPNSEIREPKDGGVDAVVFRSIDSRSGSLVFVGNCGCGRNWLRENKHRERASERLEQLLSLPKRYNMFDFFALPFHIVDKGDWREATHEGRLFLDRLRIARILEMSSWDPNFNLANALRRNIESLIALSDPAFKPRAITT